MRAMGYVSDSLGPGEEIVHSAHLHWVVYARPITALLAAAVAAGFSAQVGGILGLAALVWLGIAWILARSTELGVTTRKVVGKWGLVARSTIEQRLEKVDSISVDQGLLGRILNFGDVTVHGTGVNATPVRMIADPILFRRKVEHAIEARRDVG
jgi:hypothetical protein